MNILYPELENYIYHYCTEFKTPDELIAGKTALDDSKILAMIADGHE